MDVILIQKKKRTFSSLPKLKNQSSHDYVTSTTMFRYDEMEMLEIKIFSLKQLFQSILIQCNEQHNNTAKQNA